MLSIADIRLFLFDMDGTLYLGNKLFPFTAELLQTIRAQGKRYLFMTNNSSKSARDYVKKLARLGIPAQTEDFVTSAGVTIQVLKETYPGCRFYVAGTRSLRDEMTAAGLLVTDERDGDVGGVVLGFDTELTFRKIEDITVLLTKDPNLPYIATHPDMVCPTEYGAVPDCGALIEMLYHAVHRRPRIIGKPEPLMAERGMQMTGVSPEQTLVVGDRLYTDIACGLRAGAKTLLVFSGETTPAMWEACAEKPTYTAADAGAILAALRSL